MAAYGPARHPRGVEVPGFRPAHVEDPEHGATEAPEKPDPTTEARTDGHTSTAPGDNPDSEGSEDG